MTDYVLMNSNENQNEPTNYVSNGSLVFNGTGLPNGNTGNHDHSVVLGSNGPSNNETDSSFESDIDDLALGPEGFLLQSRTIKILIGIKVAIVMAAFFLLLYTVFLFQNNWTNNCDKAAKIWCVVWQSRLCLVLMIKLMASLIHLRYGRTVRFFVLCTRYLHFFGITWWLYGIKVILVDPGFNSCSASSIDLAKALFWAQFVVLFLPLLLYIILCLSLPFIIYVFIRSGISASPRNPTPEDVIQKLKTISFKSHILELKKKYYTVSIFQEDQNGGPGNQEFANNRTTSNIDLSKVLLGDQGTFEAAASGIAAIGATVTRISSIADVKEEIEALNEAESRQCITINKMCPICMQEMHDDELVTILPCDVRHLFHKICINGWLNQSQLCPICRASIVSLLRCQSNNAAPSGVPEITEVRIRDTSESLPTGAELV